MKQIDGQCLCSSLSVISDYAITGSTPYCICESGELNHFAWCRIYAVVNWIQETGSALVQAMAGCLFGTKPLSKSSWIIVNYTLGNKLQWNSNKKYFIHENAFEYIICAIETILSMRGWFKSVPHPAYLRVWLHVYMVSTRRQSGPTGGAWNSLDTTEQTPLWYVTTLGTADTHRPGPLQWLQMPWCQLGTRPSTTNMLIWLW